MRPETINRDDVDWIEIGRAAKLSRTKAANIREAVDAESIPSIEVDGKHFIPLTAANRLKREAAFMRSVERTSKIGDTLGERTRPGPLSAHREKQDVLPMSSGRAGWGWKG
jgi:hypothetical protein